MDGTLLNSEGSGVSPRNAAALERAAAAGATVVIATGRPVVWLGPVIDAGFTGTAICMNGALTYHIGTGQVLSASPMLPAAMESFVASLTRRTEGFTLAVERLGTSLHDFWAESSYRHPWVSGDHQVVDRTELLSAPAAKLLVRGPADSLSLAIAAREAAADAAVGEQLSITYSTDDGLIEIAAAGINKGRTLSELARGLGIDPRETIAFGDMPNDLEMLAWAGHGVAMGNGHPAVTAIADEIAPHHGEDGVAVVLERWF